MTARHSPTIALANARRYMAQAEQNCHHWDFESDGDQGHDCCRMLRDARVAVRIAKQKARRDAE